MNELANKWVEENVRPDKDTWLAREAFEAGYSQGVGASNGLYQCLQNICRSRGFDAGPSGNSTEDRVIALAQDRDQLLEALEALCGCQPTGEWLRYYHGRTEVENAREALAKAQNRR